jgi:cell division protein FtsI/penicillin-binding protein 2
VQILGHENYYSIRAQQNEYVSQESKRGTIFGTLKNGELYPLAEDEVLYKLVLSPKDIPETYEDRLYILLNKITPIDQDTFFQKLKNKKDTYEEIKILSKEERDAVEELGIQGVQTYETYKRKYPLGNIGGRIIGFVGGGEDGFSGRYGLEKFYESDLNSKSASTLSFFTKIFNPEQQDDDVKLSKNIVTSLEPNVMKYMNQVLVDMKENWGADEASAIVMDSKTGQIIAMDTVPGFDPNNYKDFDIKTFVNPSVQGVYELGSIMKPITLSGAIESGLIKPSTVYHDYGFVKVDNYTIKNFDEKVRGDQTMQDVISNSLNTGAVYVQQLMGRERFKQNFQSFGLDQETNIDFPGEVNNKTNNLDDSQKDVNFATAAFGQGVAVTPISMLSSLNIIPNQGLTTCPHFLDYKILQNGGKIVYECDTDPKQVVSTTTAKTMNQMLVKLIDEGLAHGRYKDKNYKIAAKTGTAQLPSPDGKYYKDKFIHSYFTFFPAENPRYSVLIYQVNPKKGLLASITLAPYATKLKDFLLTYYNVPPDR